MLSVECDQKGADARWLKDGIMLNIEKNTTGSKGSICLVGLFNFHFTFCPSQCRFIVNIFSEIFLSSAI